MNRPDLTTLAWVNSECPRYNPAGENNLTVRKEFGQNRIRLLRCRKCPAEFFQRRGTARFNTKISEARAVSVGEHLAQGCGIRPTARLAPVCDETVARWRKAVGRQATAFHDHWVRDLTPQALRFDPQWSFVNKATAWRRDGGCRWG